MGSSRVGGLPLRRAPPRVETRGQKLQTSSGSTPDVISYNKGQSNERLAQAVWARAIARRRLVREVGSDKRRRRVPASTSTRLEAAAGAVAP